MSYLEYTFTFSDASAAPATDVSAAPSANTSAASFTDVSAASEMLIAFLDAYNYEGFQESGDQLIAYVAEAKKDENLLATLLEQVGGGKVTIRYSSRVLPDINWNAKWESDFQPVEIDDFVRIRASFHGRDERFEHDIIIDPKMSFGTGHHATTRLMMRAMRTFSFSRKKVADLGCGTAVLSILASRMGAAEVLAVDVDEWAVSNSLENIEGNNISNITVKLGDVAVAVHERVDIVLANINRNVLLEYMFSFNRMLPVGGNLVLSGIMLQDKKILTIAAENIGFHPSGLFSENNWCALVFRKDPAK